MIAQAVVVLPHAVHITPWIVAVGLFCGCWRWMVFQGRWDYPQRWVKVLLVVASAIGVGVERQERVQSRNGDRSVDRRVCTEARRDEESSRCVSRDSPVLLHHRGGVPVRSVDRHHVVRVLSMVIVTAAMVGLHQLHTRVRASTSLRTATVLVMQAVPLMLVLFLFFPRVAPLWSVPLPGGTRTGISDHVAPGDIAALTRSDEIAFRAVFDGPVPPPRALYWRGLVYSNFSQGTWSVGGMSSAPENAPVSAGLEPTSCRIIPGSNAVSYQVLMEPTQASWLFALDVAMPVARGTSLTRDFRLITDEPIHTMFRYRGAGVSGCADGSRSCRTGCARAKHSFRTTTIRASSRSRKTSLRTATAPRRFSTTCLQYIRTQGVLLHVESAAAQRRGQRRCVLVRFAPRILQPLCRRVRVSGARRRAYRREWSADIRAAKSNPLTGHLVVRQYDAHAWTEVWLEGRGWVRFDPTAAVAPARIESGLECRALGNGSRGVSPRSPARASKAMPGLRDVMYLFESMQHRWNMWVVGYDTRDASALSRGSVGQGHADARRSRDAARWWHESGARRLEFVLAASTRAGSSCATRVSTFHETRLVRSRTDARAAGDTRRAFSRASMRRAIAAIGHLGADRSSRFAALQSRRPLQQESLARAAQRSASVAGRCRAARAFVDAVRRKCRDWCDQRRASAFVRRPTVI